MKNFLFTLILLSPFVLIGCATAPKKIAAQSVSSLPYAKLTKVELLSEMERVGSRGAELHRILQKEANKDKVQAGAAILFLPAALLLEGGDSAEATEYARLKGEYDAMKSVAVSKGIPVSELPPSAEDRVGR